MRKIKKLKKFGPYKEHFSDRNFVTFSKLEMEQIEIEKNKDRSTFKSLIKPPKPEITS